ncbi:MAG: PD-(D/E)XK nuclease family protein [Bacteroidota bacterium]|uniref:PD-(D/E)XK nuclease family protein n=1 Tax=Macellibacteroides fermentans TaxID=879969 RepID=UPI0028915B00|nr:PD-(D/E)XK nuclease family protein [Bacteroidota bacterium]HML71898.1 PD-(D/E)XK nuclease family protein [Macellibacteroides fermentans]
MNAQPENLIKQIDLLLSHTRSVISHQKERERLLGEKFNVFSILRMERSENSTHSAFISELLKPDGSHLKGDLFLRLFLKVIGNDSFELESAKVITEYYIGKVDLKGKTGGRIDIFISDKKGFNISIENKIDASDEANQIERYCKFKKDYNTVYYLTLDGRLPSVESSGELIEGKDFFAISYKKEILEWLQLCLKESVDNPILRESIKQYLILIKKITHTMEDNAQIELLKLILKYPQEAEYIANNYKRAIDDVKENIRNKVIESLLKELNNKYSVIKGDNINSQYAQIWIKPKNCKDDSKIYFGIETFNGNSNANLNGDLFVGVILRNGPKTEVEYKKKNEYEHLSDWWPAVCGLKDNNGNVINLGNIETIYKLASDEKNRNEYVNMIVDQVLAFIKSEEASLEDCLSRI